jgi:hypothetical protein
LEIKPENTSKPIIEAAKVDLTNYGKPQIISGIYQKDDNIFIQIYSPKSNKAGDFCLQLKNEIGQIIRTFSCQFEGRTVYTTYFSVNELPKGKYALSLDLKENGTSGDYFFDVK